MQIFSTHLELMAGVPLYVYAIQGKYSSAIIDTGILAMRDAVLDICKQASSGQPLAWILTTHAHADHIGNHHAVSQAFGAKIACGGNTAWLEDFDQHYQEFCLPDVVAEPPNQRQEILGLMDAPTIPDLVLRAGSIIRLGETDLEVLTFPGHKLEEIGFLENQTGTLFLGDVLLALAAPFFHGFDTSSGFHASLNQLQHLLETGRVKRVLAAHHPPLEPTAALQAVAQTRAFLLDVQEATLEAANNVDFRTLWQAVSAKLGKVADFRGYAMLQAQVRELEAAGQLRLVNNLWERR
jgi:glyoxylase-like metal-dependent hydrolase (beta-lactamase superfamily II)